MDNIKSSIRSFISNNSSAMTSSIKRKYFYEKAKENPLWIEINSYANSVDIYKKSNTPESRKKVDTLLLQLVPMLAEHLNIVKIAEITPECWTGLLDQVKQPNLKYDDDVPKRFCSAFRTIGRVLSFATLNAHYEDYTKVRRYTAERLRTLEEASPNQIKWREQFRSWVNDELHIKSTKAHYLAFEQLLQYLSLFREAEIDPLIFLSKHNSKEALAFFKQNSQKSYAKHLSYMYKFTLWIVETQMSEKDDDGVFVSIGYPIITTYQFDQLPNKYKALSPSESTQVKIPTSFLFTLQEILTENDFEWPKSISNQYFRGINPESNEIESIWSPVHTYNFLTMLEIPIRKIQVQMLDSGEGDAEYFNVISKKWGPNSSIHKGYWNSIKAVRPARGAITKVIDGLRETVGFYISTNKTADIKVGFGPESGYVIPWNNVLLIQRLDELRSWQEKYYPVSGPLAYRDIVPGATTDRSPSESVLVNTPSRFYLFRCPITSKNGSPATSSILMRFWQALMDKLEQRLKEQGEDVQIVLRRNPTTNQPEQTLFNPHGLRVAGLTSLAEAGVPIEVLSKIVAGHSSILMTIYYIKYGDGYITETLDNAKRQVEDNAKNDLKNWLKDATYEEAKRYMVANSSTGLSVLLENKALSAIWGGSSLGICPFGGARCDDGGPMIKKPTGATKGKFGPVPGGQGNCMQCRHFVTGLPWLIELWLHGNKLLEEINFQSKGLEELRAKQLILIKQRHAFMKNNETHLITSDLITKIKNLDALIETRSEQLDATIYNAHAAYNYINQVRKLTPLQSDDKSVKERTELAETKKDNDLGIEFVDATDFQVKNVLVQASRAYPEIADARVEMERDHFVDKILVNNGFQALAFSPLTKEEKRAASDALSNLLLSKVGAAECECLHNGRKTLSEAGIEEDITLSLERTKEDPSQFMLETE
tara:strand:- start:10040 stop:12847 length:2808 start_codon:yes stop_codon:yes gene_type:complete